ncbi:NACHT domain-containing protein [Anaerolinea sp.]|uniref:NACHT domain-containing protein n=1 Tax=Anaerolinea sp. TaxID=1872519 RepID=UPI002ACD5B2D|nr:HEAT repeat domain-containing protein [Anaerolinea sp.]
MVSFPRIDLTSFVLGFIAASLFWWLIARLRLLIPPLINRIKKFFQDLRERNLEVANQFLQKDTLQRAQRMHLAAALFPLDEILIRPAVLAPPLSALEKHPAAPDSIASQFIPYTPDWPELSANYPVETLTLEEATCGHPLIAVVGVPGSGKSVALAHLASQIVRNEVRGNVLKGISPFYFHIREIEIFEEVSDPLQPVLQFFQNRLPVILRPRFHQFLTDRFNTGRALLLIDGVDELSPEELRLFHQYLNLLRSKYPTLRIILAASPLYLNGLIESGFQVLALSSWGFRQREEFLERWCQAWERWIVPEIQKRGEIQPVPVFLLKNWLRGERGTFTPLEWALRTWLAFTGEIQSTQIVQILRSFLNRFVQGNITYQILEVIASEFLIRKASALPYRDLEKTIAQITGPRPDELGEIVSETQLKKQKKKRDIILSPSEQVLETLLAEGLLREYPGEQLGFINPLFAGYLAGGRFTPMDLPQLWAQSEWEFAYQTVRYLTLRHANSIDALTLLSGDDSMLKSNFFRLTRWLPDIPTTVSWRSSLFKQMVQYLQDENLPEGFRARVVAAFVHSGDPSVNRLFKSLFSSPSTVLKRLSLLGAGAWGDASLVPDILPLLADPSEEVRLTACLALSAIPSESAQSAIAETLMHGDEMMRQAAAETLAHHPKEGRAVIEQALKVPDLLTRRAAVLALLQFRDDWAKQLAEQVAVEDGQWVVRNVASQVAEVLAQKNPRIPNVLPAPWESPWLIGFAAKKGLGVTPNLPPIDLLVEALRSSSTEDQKAALEYARNYPEAVIHQEVVRLTQSANRAVQDTAFLVLWYWKLWGVSSGN